MTEAELRETWTRYMHRNDLSLDYDRTYILASQKIRESVNWQSVDLVDILENHPDLFVQAGLSILNELAMDAEALTMTNAAFNNAKANYARRKSITDNPVLSPWGGTA